METFKKIYEANLDEGVSEMLMMQTTSAAPGFDIWIDKNDSLLIGNIKKKAGLVIAQYSQRPDGDRYEYHLENTKYDFQAWDVKFDRLMQDVAKSFSKFLKKPVIAVTSQGKKI